MMRNAYKHSGPETEMEGNEKLCTKTNEETVLNN